MFASGDGASSAQSKSRGDCEAFCAVGELLLCGGCSVATAKPEVCSSNGARTSCKNVVYCSRAGLSMDSEKVPSLASISSSTRALSVVDPDHFAYFLHSLRMARRLIEINLDRFCNSSPTLDMMSRSRKEKVCTTHARISDSILENFRRVCHAAF